MAKARLGKRKGLFGCQIRIKITIKSICYMLLILLVILYLFDFIGVFNQETSPFDRLRVNG